MLALPLSLTETYTELIEYFDTNFIFLACNHTFLVQLIAKSNDHDTKGFMDFDFGF